MLFHPYKWTCNPTYNWITRFGLTTTAAFLGASEFSQNEGGTEASLQNLVLNAPTPQGIRKCDFPINTYVPNGGLMAMNLMESKKSPTKQIQAKQK